MKRKWSIQYERKSGICAMEEKVEYGRGTRIWNVREEVEYGNRI